MKLAEYDYAEKFAMLREQSLYKRLRGEEKVFLEEIAFKHRLTFQEFREIVIACRDLAMWGEGDLESWWGGQRFETKLGGTPLKKLVLKRLRAHLKERKRSPTVYSEKGPDRPIVPKRNPILTEKTDKAIFGLCPVASSKTVCCNLHVIEAVENCPLGCSYCTIQTFYRDKIVFDESFAEKLKGVSLDPERFYHICTGQSSDSLAWGNRNGILDALLQFARDHPNILLELKTKSRNIAHLLEAEAPGNIVCAWSLNTPRIVQNEEHFTASFEERLEAARALADRGIQVAFHFHPMICHEGWSRDYSWAAEELKRRFQPREVLFISFGSLTLIKPVLRMIRELGLPTKILQTEFVSDPHGKRTYPDAVKINLFRTIYEVFKPWEEKVFLYLCMEKAAIWEAVFGYVYANNEEFEKAFQRHVCMPHC